MAEKRLIMSGELISKHRIPVFLAWFLRLLREEDNIDSQGVYPCFHGSTILEDEKHKRN